MQIEAIKDAVQRRTSPPGLGVGTGISIFRLEDIDNQLHAVSAATEISYRSVVVKSGFFIEKKAMRWARYGLFGWAEWNSDFDNFNREAVTALDNAEPLAVVYCWETFRYKVPVYNVRVIGVLPPAELKILMDRDDCGVDAVKQGVLPYLYIMGYVDERSPQFGKPLPEREIVTKFVGESNAEYN